MTNCNQRKKITLPEKLQMPDNRQETTDTQSQAAQQMQDLLCTDRNETENAEIIEKMVCGLHNLQIGDSTPMPLHLSKLEKQVILISPLILIRIRNLIKIIIYFILSHQKF